MLNATDLRTGRGHRWTTGGVARVRAAYTIRGARTVAVQDGEVSVKQAATELGFPADAIYNRLAHGHVPARRGPSGRWCVPWDTATQTIYRQKVANSWPRVGVQPAPTGSPHESHGLLRRRLDPPLDREVLPNGWHLRDTDSANTCGAALSEQLEHIAIPELHDLLDRDRLVAFLTAGAIGWWVVHKPLAIAYVIADQGPSRQLNEALNAVESSQPDPRTTKRLEWLRLRATASQKDD